MRRVADVKGVRWVRLFYLYPETIDDALIELLAQPPARRAVRGHAAAARGRRDAQAHAPRPRQGPAEARRRAPARQASPGSRSARRSSSATRARPQAEFDELCEFVEWARFEHAVRLPLLGRGDVRGPRAATARCRALVAANRRAQAHGAAARASRARRTARSSGREIEVLVEGPSEEHELVDEGPARGPGAGDRRQRVPVRGRGSRRRDAPRARSCRRATGTWSASCSTSRAPEARWHARVALKVLGAGAETALAVSASARLRT